VCDLKELTEVTGIDWGGRLKPEECALVITDAEGRVCNYYGMARQLLSIGGLEIKGKKITQILAFRGLNKVLQGQKIQGKTVYLNGRPYSVTVLPVVKNRKVQGAAFCFEAVTPDTHGSLEELIETQEFFDTVLDLAYDGLIVVDAKGFIIRVNQAFADFFNLKPEQMLGKHVSLAYPNSKVSRLPVVLKTGQAEIGHVHNLNGRDVVVSRIPIIRNGEIIGAVGKILFKDVLEFTDMANRAKIARGGNAEEGNLQYKSVTYGLKNIIGNSPQMLDLKETLLKVAPRGSNVLLRGESGTGKELFAHAIHMGSNRRFGPFIQVNCAAIPENLLESELFGYEEGAFTGARKGGQPGKFELAHKGTIFLDEIGEMTFTMQAKLLRALQEKEITRLGGSEPRKVDVRIVAATNVNLEELVKYNKFREDLYYRLNVVNLVIPPLRERKEDIDELVKDFIAQFNREFGLQIRGISPEVSHIFGRYNWPGNVRELRNTIERAFNLVSGQVIQAGHLPQYLLKVIANQPVEGLMDGVVMDDPASEPSRLTLGLGDCTLEKIMESMEKQILTEALNRCRQNKAQAAQLLGISRAALYKKLEKYRLA